MIRLLFHRVYKFVLEAGILVLRKLVYILQTSRRVEAAVVQMVERSVPDGFVVGSNPSCGSIYLPSILWVHKLIAVISYSYKER